MPKLTQLAGISSLSPGKWVAKLAANVCRKVFAPRSIEYVFKTVHVAHYKSANFTFPIISTIIATTTYAEQYGFLSNPL